MRDPNPVAPAGKKPGSPRLSRLKEWLALVGAGGGLGVVVLGGACATGCSLGVGSAVVAFLSSIGLGALSAILPALRVPFLVFAGVLGGYALWGFVRRGDALKAALVGGLLGVGATWIVWQALTPVPCHMAQGMSGIMARLTPVSRRIIRQGVHALWPKLGRAPSVEETRQAMGFTTDAPVLSALRELERLSDSVVEYPGTHRIRWLWPFSSEELARYESTHRGGKLTVFPLTEAVKEGVRSFGDVLKS